MEHATIPEDRRRRKNTFVLEDRKYQYKDDSSIKFNLILRQALYWPVLYNWVCACVCLLVSLLEDIEEKEFLFQPNHRVNNYYLYQKVT